MCLSTKSEGLNQVSRGTSVLVWLSLRWDCFFSRTVAVISHSLFLFSDLSTLEGQFLPSNLISFRTTSQKEKRGFVLFSEVISCSNSYEVQAREEHLNSWCQLGSMVQAWYHSGNIHLI